jgi:hypothetical protein
MGRFLKKGNDGFQAVVNGEYVDKSALIEIVNATLNTERQFTCVSRARRFGKSVGAKMLYAYYDLWSASRDLFKGLEILSSPSFDCHFRRYPVIYLDMTDFVTRYHENDVISHIQSDVIELLAEWYDGYQIGGCQKMFNPTSVMTALYNQYCDCYWANTGAYDAVAAYIRMDSDGLKDDVIRLLAGGSCSVDTASFQNDFNIVCSKDDVLTLLIHLGYLSYDRESRTCKIPNREVATEFKNAVELELKYDHSAEIAIDQIKDKQYTDSLLDFTGEVVLVGINYDKQSKKHQFEIERVTNN